VSRARTLIGDIHRELPGRGRRPHRANTFKRERGLAGRLQDRVVATAQRRGHAAARAAETSSRRSADSRASSTAPSSREPTLSMSQQGNTRLTADSRRSASRRVRRPGGRLIDGGCPSCCGRDDFQTRSNSKAAMPRSRKGEEKGSRCRDDLGGRSPIWSGRRCREALDASTFRSSTRGPGAWPQLRARCARDAATTRGTGRALRELEKRVERRLRRFGE